LPRAELTRERAASDSFVVHGQSIAHCGGRPPPRSDRAALGIGSARRGHWRVLFE
jgi:hypothetical protein